MILKTLNDLKWNTVSSNSPDINSRELKAEAIKWVNYHNKKGMMITRLDFMEFFNIIQEDLK